MAQSLRRGALLAVGLACVAGALTVYHAGAADHRDAPLTTADVAADINDVYAFIPPNDLNSLVCILTFAPFSTVPVYDDDVLYQVHIDNTRDGNSDISIECRFARDGNGNFGLRVDNLPGSTGPLTGPVGLPIIDGNLRAQAGLFDDPFFFDLEGFRTTLQTGTLSFVNTRDAFASANTMAIVLQMNLNAALNGNDSLELFASTGRR